MASISILIPVFNWDCTRLVHDLQKQASTLQCQYEIIVADDCSSDKELRHVNEKISELDCCRFIPLERNIGRSAIRNMLADKAIFPWLLFLDCDAQVASATFLKDYLEAAENSPLVCGGLRHPETLPRPGVELRYRYERRADLLERPACVRQSQPYARFTPFSFLIRRDIFMSIRFCEQFSRYGYEDVLFGKELQDRQIPILHIDNPLIHLGLEENQVFLNKTQESLRTLAENRQSVNNASKLLRSYNRLTTWHINWLLHLAYGTFGAVIRRNLTGSRPNLRLFSLYKLLYFAEICRNPYLCGKIQELH